MDLDYTWLDVADTGEGGGPFFAPLLNRYLAAGHMVVWLGGLMDETAQAAFRRFLRRGGRLLLVSVELRLSAGIDPFFEEMLHMRTPAKTSASRVRFVEGFDAAAIDLFAYYAIVELWPPARALLLDTNDRTAGMYLDENSSKVVYLPFSLKKLKAPDRHRLRIGDWVKTRKLSLLR